MGLPFYGCPINPQAGSHLISDIPTHSIALTEGFFNRFVQQGKNISATRDPSYVSHKNATRYNRWSGGRYGSGELFERKLELPAHMRTQAGAWVRVDNLYPSLLHSIISTESIATFDSALRGHPPSPEWWRLVRGEDGGDEGLMDRAGFMARSSGRISIRITPWPELTSAR